MPSSLKTEVKLLIFKLVVGTKDMNNEEIDRIFTHIKNRDLVPNIPGYKIEVFYLPDNEVSKLDITLLYPPANTFLSEEEFLDLLKRRGEVPSEILDKIKNEINGKESSTKK